MPWYSSVHRGSGLKSQVATAAFEGARDAVARFVGAPAGRRGRLRAQHDRGDQRARRRAARGHARAPTPVEHHANMLPVAPPRPAAAAVHRARRRSCSTAASGAARRARGRPGRGHRRVERHRRGVAGRRAGRARARARRAAVRRRRPARAAPADRHGGARASTSSPSRATSSTRRSAPARWSATLAARRRRRCCTAAGRSSSSRLDDVVWADAPERHEAGSPNVVGAVALAAACRALLELGMDAVAEHERALAARLWTGSRTSRPRAADAVARAASTASASRPSTSTATAIRCWPRS